MHFHGPNAKYSNQRIYINLVQGAENDCSYPSGCNFISGVPGVTPALDPSYYAAQHRVPPVRASIDQSARGLLPLNVAAPSCVTSGTCDSNGGDVTVTTNFDYTPIGYYPVSNPGYAVTGYYNETGRMGTGTSSDRMTINCQIKASALESAEFNLGAAVITLLVTGGAFVAAEAVTTGAATVAVGGLLAIELSVFSATDALQSARLDYREAGC